MRELIGKQSVIPAFAGIQKTTGTENIAGGQHLWIPAFAGMTGNWPGMFTNQFTRQ